MEDVNEAKIVETEIRVGIAGNSVVIQNMGNDSVRPSFVMLTPLQAREVAALLLTRAAMLDEREKE